MTKKATTFAAMIIAAVLLVGIAFAGAASATEIQVTDWNTQITADDDYKILIDDLPPSAGDVIKVKGEAAGYVINPKYIGSAQLKIPVTLTLDFSEYAGNFAGISESSTSDNVGALFGSIYINDGCTLTIVGLNMTSVKVLSSGSHIGGIIGDVKGSEEYPSGRLNLSNCHLTNCFIGGDNNAYVAGGLVGSLFSDTYEAGDSAAVNVDNCSIAYSTVVLGNEVGGLIGESYIPVNFEKCAVLNCSVANKDGFLTGGIISFLTNDVPAKFVNCTVANSSVYCANSGVGGLSSGTAGSSEIKNCSVENCIIVCYSTYTENGRVGGMLGDCANEIKITNSAIRSSTISGNYDVGGIVGTTEWGSIAPGSSNNELEDIAVNCIYNTTVGYSVGSGQEIPYTINGDTYLHSSDGGDSISLLDKNGDSISDYTEFWKKISSTTGNGNTVSNIGEYGKVGGYGFGSYPDATSGYTVTYDANGATRGTVPVDTDSPYESGATVTVLGNEGGLARTGYTFDGWEFSDGSLAGDEFVITEDTTLYAHWKIAQKKSSGQTGYTVILTETQTAVPTVTPTQSSSDGTSVIMPSVQQTAKPATTTSASPAPFVGLIAGLGIAGLVLRLRK